MISNSNSCVMNKLNFRFCKAVSAVIHVYSQFTQDVCDWISCQFALESNFGRSSLALSDFNFCGMKNPIFRISTAFSAGNSLITWARYDSLQSCCIDYLLCLQYHKPSTCDYDTIEHFALFISKFYCPDKDYIDRVNRIYSQFKAY